MKLKMQTFRPFAASSTPGTAAANALNPAPENLLTVVYFFKNKKNKKITKKKEIPDRSRSQNINGLDQAFILHLSNQKIVIIFY